MDRPLFWTEFPTDLLPDRIADFVRAAANATATDEGMVGPAVVTALAGAIGNAAAIELQSTYSPPCVIWTMLVGRSGAGKSPAIELATYPLRVWDEWLRKKYRDAATAAAIAGRDPREIPFERLVVSDATVEALAPMLQDSPRGLVYIRDELRGLWGSFDRFSKGSRSGGDESAYLSMFDARSVEVDRKTSPPIFVPRAALSICGGVQPKILGDMLREADYSSGLVPRFNIVHPPSRARRWKRDAGVPEAVHDGYIAALCKLFTWGMAESSDASGPRPTRLRMSDGAEDAWVEFHDRLHGEAEDSDDDNTAAVLVKKVDMGARLAAVLHVARWACEELEPEAEYVVDAKSMKNGTALAEWFARETLRVLASINEGERESIDRRRLEWIAARGGEVSVRDFQRGSPRPRPASTDQAVDVLMDLEGVEQVPQTGTGGGAVFRLCEAPSDENHPHGGDLSPRRHVATSPERRQAV